MLPTTFRKIQYRWPRCGLTREQFLRREHCDAEFEALEDYVTELKSRVQGEIPEMSHFRGIKWPLTVAALAGVTTYTVQDAAAELGVSHSSLNRRADEIPHFITASGRRMYLIGDLNEARRKFVKAPKIREQFPRQVVWVKCEHCGARHREYREVKDANDL